MSKKKKKFKLKEKHFEILIKILIITCLISGFMAFITEAIFRKEKIRDIMITIFMISFITQALISSFYENIARFLNKHFKTSLERKIDI